MDTAFPPLAQNSYPACKTQSPGFKNAKLIKHKLVTSLDRHFLFIILQLSQLTKPPRAKETKTHKLHNRIKFKTRHIKPKIS